VGNTVVTTKQIQSNHSYEFTNDIPLLSEKRNATNQ